MIVMYACNYISGWTYDVMRPLEATFINGIPEERKFFDDAVTVYGSITRRQDNARRIIKRLQEPHKQYVTSHDPMGNSEELSLYESMRTALQSMQTAMQAKIVESLKTFEYEGRTYDIEHISNRLLEKVEEEMNRLLENVEEEIEPQRPATRN